MKRGATAVCGLNLFAVCGLTVFAVSLEAHAQEPAHDAISYRGHVDTAARLFERSASPGAGGALPQSEHAAPLYHHAMLRVDDLDVPWRVDSVDLEFSAWGELQLADRTDVRRVEGDIQIAKVRQRFRNAHVTFGRQIRAGGAARYAHFDGVEAGVRASALDMGFDIYGGLTVLPRWTGRQGYHLLGTASDTLLRDPALADDPDRAEHWLGGGRFFVQRAGLVTVGASLHEQHADDGLAYRTAGLDFSVTPLSEVEWTSLALLDMDALAPSELRTSVDVFPVRWLTIGGIYQHLTPALLLSRQSVLSVFSTSTFDEWGLDTQVKPVRWLRVGAEGFVERFESGDAGARAGGSLRFVDQDFYQASSSIGYRRVVEPENGYHRLHGSASAHPLEVLEVTGDGYLYLYDERIGASDSSLVGILSTIWTAHRLAIVGVSGTIARTPYANVDAQALVRVTVPFEGGAR